MDIYDKLNCISDSIADDINTQYDNFIINEFRTEYKKLSDTEYRADCKASVNINKNKVIELISKDIPKKVVVHFLDSFCTENVDYYCPNCGKGRFYLMYDGNVSDRYNYCCNCGQKLDWSELC